MENREIQMFGCTKEDLNYMLEDAIESGVMLEMLAMSILSDAQEVMKQDPEEARQFINKAKWVMSQQIKNKIAA